MKIEEWLGEDNKLGIDIWKKKYQYNGETFDQWLDRVSAGDEDVKKLIKEKKFLFGGRILANRGLDKQGVRTTYSNCFSGDTVIITSEGRKTLQELVGKQIKVLSNSSFRDATVQCFGKQPVKKLHVGKNGIEKTFTVTPNHIWFAQHKNEKSFSKYTTDELKPGMILQSDVLKCYRNYKPSPFGVAHGFFYGDGDHTGENNRRVNFCGDKSELIPYFTPDTIGNSNGVLTICGIPKCFWGKPALNEAPAYLYGWLAGYFAADGSVDNRGNCVICSSKRSDLEFVQDVLCVLGIPYENIRVQHRLSNLTNEYSDVFILTLNKYYLNDNFFILSKHKNRALKVQKRIPTKYHVISVEDTNEEIDVYCAVVPDTHSFCLDNNIKTHNCYVVEPPQDNLESIFDTAKKLARTFSYGGGVGIDISNLAPRGAKVHNTAKNTTGAVSFMDLYSLVTGLIGQAGRRGALMLSLSCTHPDLEEFIGVKADLDKVTKANISVRITDEFMQSVKEGKKFELSFTREATGETIKKVVDAREIFHKFAEMNWRTGEPGMLFWDTIERYNLLNTNSEFHYAGVNPCNLSVQGTAEML